MVPQTRASRDVGNGAEMIKEYRIGFWDFGKIVGFGVATYLQFLAFQAIARAPWWVMPLTIFLTVPMEIVVVVLAKTKYYAQADKIVMKRPDITVEILWDQVKSIKRVWNIYNGFSFWVRSKKNKKDVIIIPDTVIGYEELLQIISEKSGVSADLKIRL